MGEEGDFRFQISDFRFQISDFRFQISDVQCSVFSVQCSVFSVQCSVFSVQCSVFSVQCSVFSEIDLRIIRLFRGFQSSTFVIRYFSSAICHCCFVTSQWCANFWLSKRRRTSLASELLNRRSQRQRRKSLNRGLTFYVSLCVLCLLLLKGMCLPECVITLRVMLTILDIKRV